MSSKAPFAVYKEQDELEAIAERELQKISAIYPHGLCIGEGHSNPAPKKFLIENMSWLAQEGFTELYFPACRVSIWIVEYR